jgi:hypothetical protein
MAFRLHECLYDVGGTWNTLRCLCDNCSHQVLNMSVRTWSSSFGQSTAVFIMMIFWFLLILLGVTQQPWRINAPAIIGLIFFGGCFGFYHRLKGLEAVGEFKNRCPRCGWQNIKQVDVKDNLLRFKCMHCSNSWYVRKDLVP